MCVLAVSLLENICYTLYKTYVYVYKLLRKLHALILS